MNYVPNCSIFQQVREHTYWLIFIAKCIKIHMVKGKLQLIFSVQPIDLYLGREYLNDHSGFPIKRATSRYT